MSLIFFNNVIAMEIPELDMEGLYRVVAISDDGALAGLVQLPMAVSSIATSGIKPPGVRNIKKILLAILEGYQKLGHIRQVELRLEPELLMADSVAQNSHFLEYERRQEIMRPFLLHKNLSWALFSSQGLGPLVREAKTKFGCSRTSVYKFFSLLCVHGFLASSLHPRYDRCGAPGVTRPCGGSRKKAGRKTNRERLGVVECNSQRGVTSEDRTRMTALYQTLKRPGLSDIKVYQEIIARQYITDFKTTVNGFEPMPPVQGSYPNYRQFRHMVESEIDQLHRLKMTTTEGHYNRNKRGLKGKSYQDVAGPGHQYAIDSTIADVFLVSSINRAWVCGRPIVYIVVDVWSTAIVGFYVCWTGPSWDMAKVALFCVAAGGEFVSNLWGFNEYLWLDPQPTLPANFLSDRGEYLSEASRQTSRDLTYNMQFNPSYRPDLKGLVEVLNRIAKDEQYAFIPGAIDARRKELELRGRGKVEATLTVNEYTQYLTNIFNAYNLSADRSDRLDAEMISDGVEATPAGLWRWGHQVGYGYRMHTPLPNLIKHLLPGNCASINRSGVHFAGLSYEGLIAERDQWTANARNFGATQIPVHYFPGATSKIWWLGGSAGLNQLDLSPYAKATPTTCLDEWLDAVVLNSLGRADREKNKLDHAVKAMNTTKQIVESARQATHAAKSISPGPHPHLRDVRTMEAFVQQTESIHRAEVSSSIPIRKVDEHNQLVGQLLSQLNRSLDDGN
jgi:putative transposase